VIAKVKLVHALLAACVVCPVGTPLGAERPAASDYLFPKDRGMYVGVDYYPEHWPPERWEADLRMMKEAGFNIVRVAEFSWVLFEPEEGRYEFNWLDRWLALAEKYDIKVIIGTPTAIMPAWLARKYPEALEMKATGQRTVWGGRRHNCFSDKDFRRLSEAIVHELAKHYATNRSIVGWQIDNEFGNADCYCEKCQTTVTSSIVANVSHDPLM
jgi:beta-galactosidase